MCFHPQCGLLPQLEALLATWRTEPSHRVRSIRSWPPMAVTKGSFPISSPSQSGGIDSGSFSTLLGGLTTTRFPLVRAEPYRGA